MRSWAFWPSDRGPPHARFMELVADWAERAEEEVARWPRPNGLGMTPNTRRMLEEALQAEQRLLHQQVGGQTDGPLLDQQAGAQAEGPLLEQQAGAAARYRPGSALDAEVRPGAAPQLARARGV